jgi:hypothetical protein
MSKIDSFLQILPDLHLNQVNGRRKPYKPLLLLTVLWRFHRDGHASEYLVLDDELVEDFRAVAGVVLGKWDGPALVRSVVAQPYRHLSNDFMGTGLWDLVAAPGSECHLAAAQAGPHRLKDLMSMIEAVHVDAGFLAELAESRELPVRLMDEILRTHADVFAIDAWQRWSRFLQVAPVATTPMVLSKFTEAAVESALVHDWCNTPWAMAGVTLQHALPPARQHRTSDGGRIDVLGHQPSRLCWWIIELKRGRPNDAVVGQVLRYVGWLARHPAATSHEVVGALLAQQYDTRLVAAIRATSNLSLWTYDDDLKVSRVPI